MKTTVFAVWSTQSNGMKSNNPYRGCVSEIDIARTLDCTNPDPSKNQGGVLILEDYFGICSPGRCCKNV